MSSSSTSSSSSSSFFTFILFIITVLLSAPTCRTAPPLTIRDNGYEGLVVAIGVGVAEDPRIVDNIQSLIASASAELYTATESRAFFRTVTVVVPSNWTRSPEYEQVSGIDRFTTAHIRIDRPNPEYGNNPYTLQPGGCGEPGIYVHLTPEFVSELHGITTEEYGFPGRTLVHEWAHLRYGVYDEYGSWDDFRTPPFFRDDDQKVRVTGCPSNVSGTFQGPDCSSTGENGVPGQDCIFVPNQDNETSETSIMYMHFLPHADGFCGSSHERPHDPLPPTKHNVLCQGRSTWDVIMSNRDFADGRNEPRQVMDTRPRFRIVQPRQGDAGTFVLLLDVSGSMSGQRMSTLHRAATGFLANQVPLDSHVAVVAFSTTPRTLAALTRVTEETRPQLLRRLPVRDDRGQTAIGLALNEALKVLRDGQGTAEDAVVLLVTDGEENVAPYVRDVRAEVLASGLVVHAVAFGRYASRHLEPLAAATGGRTFWYRDEDNVAPVALQAALLASADAARPENLRHSGPVQIVSKSWSLGPAETFHGKVTVDPALGRNTRFTFTYTGNGIAPRILLVPPGGGVPQILTADPAARSLTLHLADAQAGNWTYNAISQSKVKQGVGLTVTSETRDLDEPVRARAWLGDSSIRLPQDGVRAKIFAEVKRGYEAVLDALVVATVERPLGDPVTVRLLDDGAGDGIYTAYFALFNGTGRYGVTAAAQDAGRALLRSEPLTSGSKALSRVFKFRGHHHVPRSAGAFERVAVAGSFRVDGWSAAEDRLPPNRVTDLRVFVANGRWSASEDLMADLVWTSPGDDMDQGLASSYQIRFSSTVIRTEEDFDSAIELLDNHVTSGSLTPMSGGRRHRISVTLPANVTRGDAVYVALRATDEAGNRGAVSNIAVIEREVLFAAGPPGCGSVSWMGIGSGVMLVVLLSSMAIVSRLKKSRYGKPAPLDVYGTVRLTRP